MSSKTQEVKYIPGININYTSFKQKEAHYLSPNLNEVNPIKRDIPIAHVKGRPGGGWDSDEDQSQNTKGNSSLSANNKPESKAFSFINTTNNQISNPISEYIILEVDEDFLKKHVYEEKLINDTIQPGGVRLKQNDKLVNEFCIAAENLNVVIIGSLLINKIRSNVDWISKARSLYNIEALAKRHPKYFEYFKKNIKALKEFEFSNEGAYSNQLRNITDSIIGYLENPNHENEKPSNSTSPLNSYQGQFNTPQQNGQSVKEPYDNSCVFNKENFNANLDTKKYNDSLKNSLKTQENTQPQNEIHTPLQIQTLAQINKPMAFKFINNPNDPNCTIKNSPPNKTVSMSLAKLENEQKPKTLQTNNTLSLLDVDFSLENPQYNTSISNGKTTFDNYPSSNGNYVKSPPYVNGGYLHHNQIQYPNGYQYPIKSQYIGYGANSNVNGYQIPQRGIKDFEYDIAIAEIQSGVNYFDMNEEMKNKDFTIKKKQKELDNHFDFIKFQIL